MGGVRCLGLFPKKKSIFFYPFHYPIVQKHYLHDCVQAQPHVGLHEHNDHRNDQFPSYLAAFCGTINHDDDQIPDDVSSVYNLKIVRVCFCL